MDFSATSFVAYIATYLELHIFCNQREVILKASCICILIV